MPGPRAVTLHAGCILVGEAGVLIRGPSGSGKSSLARALLAEAAARGRFARLVGDDRVRVETVSGRLVSRPIAGIAGLEEMRGVGIMSAPWEAAAVVRVVIDCCPEAPRLPDYEDRFCTLRGVVLPRLIHTFDSDAARLVLRQNGGIYDTLMTQL